MTVSEDIIQWAKTRPIWQQETLQSLVAADSIDQHTLNVILDSLLGHGDATANEVLPLDLALPPSGDEQISLISLSSCKGVNALADCNDLQFAPMGLNVIYGDNGSGKSGYARLLKGLVGARHVAQVLPNVFVESPTSPSAVLNYISNDWPEEQNYPGPAAPVLKRISYYDEHCGDVYLTSKSTVNYRPSALLLLDRLIAVCDQLRDRLLEKVAESGSSDLSVGELVGVA